MWSKGIIEVTGMGARVEFQVKHYSVGSEFGIDGGKISKLAMTINGKMIAHYERGWDIRPDRNAPAIMGAYQEILKKYN